MKLVVIFSVISLLAVSQAHANATIANARVVEIAITSTGDARLTLASSHGDPLGCGSSTGIDILRTSPEFEARVALMTSALLSGSNVKFFVTTCNGQQSVAVNVSMAAPA